MEIYENEYTRAEDEVLWELHGIRHKLSQELIGKTINQINDDAKRKWEEWKTAYHKETA
jgi:hypothetical protein